MKICSESPKLLDQMWNQLRVIHYARKSEQAYLMWIERFLRFHRERNRGRWRHPRQMGKTDIEHYLTYLAVDKGVAAWRSMWTRVGEKTERSFRENVWLLGTLAGSLIKTPSDGFSGRSSASSAILVNPLWCDTTPKIPFHKYNSSYILRLSLVHWLSLNSWIRIFC